MPFSPDYESHHHIYIIAACVCDSSSRWANGRVWAVCSVCRLHDDAAKQ